jgi:hypothetical protein
MTWLEKLTDEKRLDVIVKLLPYVIPRHTVLKLEPQAAELELPQVGIQWIESSDERSAISSRYVEATGKNGRPIELITFDKEEYKKASRTGNAKDVC